MDVTLARQATSRVLSLPRPTKFYSGETGTLEARHVEPHPPRCLLRFRSLRVHHIKRPLRVLYPKLEGLCRATVIVFFVYH